jgi:hypothetical protein
MIVNVHIERLVLDGVAGGAGEGARIEAAVRMEMARLWVGAGAASLPRASVAVPALRGTALSGGATTNAARLGGAIAQSVHGAVAK